MNDIVAYAQRISYTSFAPADFAPGVMRPWCRPPCPQPEEEMRASVLYRAPGTWPTLLKVADL